MMMICRVWIHPCYNCMLMVCRCKRKEKKERSKSLFCTVWTNQIFWKQAGLQFWSYKCPLNYTLSGRLFHSLVAALETALFPNVKRNWWRIRRGMREMVRGEWVGSENHTCQIWRKCVSLRWCLKLVKRHYQPWGAEERLFWRAGAEDQEEHAGTIIITTCHTCWRIGQQQSSSTPVCHWPASGWCPSCASCSSVPHLISASTVLHRVVFGQPRFHLPSGVQSIAILVIELEDSRSTCPIQRHGFLVVMVSMQAA